MTIQLRTWIGLLGGALLLSTPLFARVDYEDHQGGATAATTAQGPQNTQTITNGAYLFRTYCAVCHGTSAQGDGPLASSLRRKPANLTEILKRNHGTFPRDLVFRIIDGRQKVQGHGGPDMPAWGDAFTRSIEGGDKDAVTARIQALVDYLESIQARDTE